MGIAGIAGGWNRNGDDFGATIYSLRITDSGANAQADDLARAILGAVNDFNCDVLNISWGGTHFTEDVLQSINSAQAQRKIIIAAMGDDGWNGGGDPNPHPTYPAQLPNSWIVAVGGSGQDGQPCIGGENWGNCNYSTNYGGAMDILAPGYLIPTTSTFGNYDMAFGGTSASAPHATGAIALILAVKNSLWSEDIDWMMRRTAIDINPPGYDPQTGWGRLNLGSIFNTLFSPIQYTGGLASYCGEYSLLNLTEFPETFYSFRNESGPITPGRYGAYRYEAIYDVTFPIGYDLFLGVWGKRYAYDEFGELCESEGWSAANPNYQVGYCEVVPGSETHYGCQLRTNYYRVYINGGYQWYPSDPNDYVARLCYAVWGIPYAGDPTRPDHGKMDGIFDGGISVSCYPNPFNSTTNIAFDLTNYAHISIYIYDILGNLVCPLISSNYSSGHYQMTWNGVNSNGAKIDSGIYFCRIKINQIDQIKRLILLK